MSSLIDRLKKDTEITAGVWVAIFVVAGVLWIALECRKIRLHRQEEEHQTEQVKDALLKAHRELFSPNNSTRDDCEEALYQSISCSICRQSLRSDTTTSISGKEPVSENSPLMESRKKKLPALLSLRCGHEFHANCVTPMMAAQKRNCDPCRCPVCLQAL